MTNDIKNPFFGWDPGNIQVWVEGKNGPKWDYGICGGDFTENYKRMREKSKGVVVWGHINRREENEGWWEVRRSTFVELFYTWDGEFVCKEERECKTYLSYKGKYCCPCCGCDEGDDPIYGCPACGSF